MLDPKPDSLKKFIFSFLGLVTVIVLAGCGPKTENDTGGSVLIEKDEATDSIQLNEEAVTTSPSLYFDGTKVVTSKIPALSAPYTIYVSLRSGENIPAETETTENSPPMPFLAGDFVVYQKGSKYIIGTKGGNIAQGGDSSDRQEIVLTVDETGEGRVFIEGEELWKGSVGDTRPIVIGKGFQQRYWKGTIFQFEVYGESVRAPDNIPGKSALLFDISTLPEN